MSQFENNICNVVVWNQPYRSLYRVMTLIYTNNLEELCNYAIAAASSQPRVSSFRANPSNLFDYFINMAIVRASVINFLG